MSTDISAPWPCVAILCPEIEQLGHAQNHIAGENWSQDSTWVKDPQVQQSWVVTRTPLITSWMSQRPEPPKNTRLWESKPQ